jgi:hypothetical protein
MASQWPLSGKPATGSFWLVSAGWPPNDRLRTGAQYKFR